MAVAARDADNFCSRFEIVEAAHTLFLHGELDISARHLLARAGEDLAERCIATRDRAKTHDTETVGAAAVIDAAGLRFIDAAGLGALVTLYNRLAAAGIALRTINAPTRLRRISAICQLEQVLGMHPAIPSSLAERHTDENTVRASTDTQPPAQPILPKDSEPSTVEVTA